MQFVTVCAPRHALTYQLMRLDPLLQDIPRSLNIHAHFLKISLVCLQIEKNIMIPLLVTAKRHEISIKGGFINW
jgi:hypothetical protein